jgi:arylsulfatase A-like enzyme
LFRTNASDAFWFVASCGWTMVAWDAVALLRAGQAAPTWDFISVLVATIALTTAHAVVAGALLAPAYALAMGDRRLGTRFADAARWVGSRLGARSPIEAVSTHSSLLAAPFALIAYVAVALPLSMAIHEDVRVAANAAGASILAHLAAMLSAVFVHAAMRGAWSAVLRPLASRNVLSGWLARPWITATVLASSALLAILLAAVLGRRTLAALDLAVVWMGLTVTVAGATVATIRTLPKLPLAARRAIGWSSILAAIVLTLVASFALPYSPRARSVLVTRTTFGKVFHANHNTLLDRDGDGFTTLFGGNDCAPRDPAIHPGAVDIPYNDIDEDCSGEDLKFDAKPPTRRWDHPLPDSFPKRPHIILLSVDALSPNHLGFNGYDRPISPHVDALAKRSVSFENAYAQGPSTRLSIPSLFTSLYDPQIKRSKHGRIPLAVLQDNLTIAEILQKAGYATVAVVPSTYFTGWSGITQGFRVVDDTATKVKGPHTSRAISDAVIERLELAMEQDQPLFLWAHYYDPHGPFDQPPGAPVFGKSSKDVYDAEIQHTDEHIGRVIAWIDEHIPPKDRLIVVTADHGESFDERHAVRHHGYDLHTDVLHVPLLWQMPAFPPRTVQGAVSLLDIAPTLVNVAGAEGDFVFEGTSLVPALLHGEGLEERVTFHTFYLPELVKKDKDPLRMVAARTERFNLIHDRETGEHSLYDFVADRGENNNLFHTEQEVVDRLVPQMQLWYFRVLGPTPARAAAPAATAVHPDPERGDEREP